MKFKASKIMLAVWLGAASLSAMAQSSQSVIEINADTDNTGDGGVFIDSEGGNGGSSLYVYDAEGNGIYDNRVRVLGAGLSVDNSVNVGGATNLSNTLSVNAGGGVVELFIDSGSITSNGALTQTGATTINGATSITGVTSINTTNGSGNTTIGHSSNTTTIQSGTNVITGGNNSMTATGINALSAATNNITATSANNIQGPVNNIGTAEGVTTNAIGNTTNGTTVTAAGGNAQMRVANNSATLTVPTASGTDNTLNGFAATGSAATMTGGDETPNRLTIHDQAATFGRVADGAPITVTGVADGKNDFDAVNVRQFAAAVAGVTAMSNIPAPEAGKTTSFGMGFGHFMSKSALAVGFSHKVSDKALIKGSVASGLQKGAKPMVGLGAGWSW